MPLRLCTSKEKKCSFYIRCLFLIQCCWVVFFSLAPRPLPPFTVTVKLFSSKLLNSNTSSKSNNQNQARKAHFSISVQYSLAVRDCIQQTRVPGTHTPVTLFLSLTERSVLLRKECVRRINAQRRPTRNPVDVVEAGRGEDAEMCTLGSIM